jgi:hypothetical protein
VAAPSQRSALGALFLVLACAFAGIAYAAAVADASGGWVIAIAAGALALWLGTLAVRAFRRR